MNRFARRAPKRRDVSSPHHPLGVGGGAACVRGRQNESQPCGPPAPRVRQARRQLAVEQLQLGPDRQRDARALRRRQPNSATGGAACPSLGFSTWYPDGLDAQAFGVGRPGRRRDLPSSTGAPGGRPNRRSICSGGRSSGRPLASASRSTVLSRWQRSSSGVSRRQSLARLCAEGAAASPAADPRDGTSPRVDRRTRAALQATELRRLRFRTSCATPRKTPHPRQYAKKQGTVDYGVAPGVSTRPSYRTSPRLRGELAQVVPRYQTPAAKRSNAVSSPSAQARRHNCAPARRSAQRRRAPLAWVDPSVPRA